MEKEHVKTITKFTLISLSTIILSLIFGMDEWKFIAYLTWIIVLEIFVFREKTSENQEGSGIIEIVLFVILSRFLPTNVWTLIFLYLLSVVSNFYKRQK